MEENKTLNEETFEAPTETITFDDGCGNVSVIEMEPECEKAKSGSGLKVVAAVAGVAGIAVAGYYGGKKLIGKLARKYVEKHPDDFEDIYRDADGKGYWEDDEEEKAPLVEVVDLDKEKESEEE